VAARNLETGSLEEETYDRLILAPGSRAVIPKVPGMDLPSVFSLKTLADTDRILRFLEAKNPRRAVVVGGGLIGVEALENLVLRGLEATVVEFAPQMLTFLDWEMAELVRRHAEAKGVRLHLSEGLGAVEERGGALVVKTDHDRDIPADLVLVAVGIRPRVALAREAGLAIGDTGGIRVNEHMQTSDPDIFAAGDCVETINLVTGKPTLTPMGSAANKQGRAAGANALGRSLAVKGFLGTVIVKVFDLTVAKTGLSEREALNEGFAPLVTYVHPGHHAGYFPGAKTLHIKTVADLESERLLGAQVIGEEGVDKRIDVFATALYNRMTQEDLLQIDLAYAPPYSAARDPVIIAGAVGQNYFRGDWRPVPPQELSDRLKRAEPVTVVDVRTAKEVSRTGKIPGAVNIPIDDLRRRIKELDPERETILYCATGLRSYVGERILSQHGFRRTRTLTGGILNWMFELEPAG
jgi:NADPH-dependent 2,4-dienoyl-CoA reductase/sulfur reductase-like enzyme/rhodanese-related sulfurtransferase